MIGLILVAAVVITILQVRRTDTVTSRLINLRAPTAQASLGMMNGINHSLAALRGWMILGEVRFKDERAKAWSKEIEPSLAKMKMLAANWTDPKNIEKLTAIESNLGDFKTFQKEIEDIAQAIENTPASKILVQEAIPKATVLGEQITRMIDLEATLASTQERKALLGIMADIRGRRSAGTKLCAPRSGTISLWRSWTCRCPSWTATNWQSSFATTRRRGIFPLSS